MHVRGRGWPASGLVPMRMHARMAWGTQSGDETAVSTSATAGRPATCSPVPGPRLGYTYNARRSPRSLQYYSRVDVPSTATPQRLREGDDLQERCVLGSRGVRPHPTNPPWLRPCYHSTSTSPCKDGDYSGAVSGCRDHSWTYLPDCFKCTKY